MGLSCWNLDLWASQQPGLSGMTSSASGSFSLLLKVTAALLLTSLRLCGGAGLTPQAGHRPGLAGGPQVGLGMGFVSEWPLQGGGITFPPSHSVLPEPHHAVLSGHNLRAYFEYWYVLRIVCLKIIISNRQQWKVKDSNGLEAVPLGQHLNMENLCGGQKQELRKSGLKWCCNVSLKLLLAVLDPVLHRDWNSLGPLSPFSSMGNEK